MHQFSIQFNLFVRIGKFSEKMHSFQIILHTK